jgi:effector-binding domain-containing protein
MQRALLSAPTLAWLLVLSAGTSACVAPGSSSGAAGSLTSSRAAIHWEADLPVSRPPYDDVSVNWKQRLREAYVFVEHTGSYTRIGAAFEACETALRAQGVNPSGAPFALYFDDPGFVAPHALRSRACYPVAAPVQVRAPLGYDELDGTTVVYAFVGGPYADVPRAYPALYEFLRGLNWVENGPVREVYLVDPAGATSPDELVCEVQIPATQRD